MFSARFIPDGSPEQIRWLTDLQRVSTSPENAVRFRRAFADADVEALLPQIATPTLVLHSRGDQAVPFEEGRRLAASIPGANLVPLDSKNHLLLEDEPAWPRLLDEILRFASS